MCVGGAHLLAQRAPAALRRAMPVVSVTVRPDGLHPIEAIKAWHKRTCEGLAVDKILAEGGFRCAQKQLPRSRFAATQWAHAAWQRKPPLVVLWSLVAAYYLRFSLGGRAVVLNFLSPTAGRLLRKLQRRWWAHMTPRGTL